MSREYSRCVLVILDGARYDALYRLLEDGELPNVKQHILDRGTLLKAVTAFPSTTGPAYVPILMGCHPGTVGIPGIRWLDKTRLAKRASGWRRSYMGYEALFLNKDLRAPAGTLFQYYRTPVNIYNMVTRNLRTGGDASRFTKPPLYLLAHFTEIWEPADRVAAWHLMRALRNRQNDLIVMVFPGLDAVTHRSHPFSRRVIACYKFFDVVVGHAARLLKKIGDYDRTLWTIVSDHGMTHTDRHLDLVGFLDRRGYKALDYPRVFRRNARAAVMISGNAMANVYFQNSRGWYGRTYRQDLQHGDADLLTELLEKPEVDVLAIRDYGGGIHILSKRGAANLRSENGKLRYTRLAGDPLGYDSMPELLDERASLEATFETDYPDALVQIFRLCESERSGDLIVSAAKGCDLRSNYEWPEHKASHGALLREQMIVPILSSHPIPVRACRTADVFPTILRLTGKPVPSDVDGISLV